MSALDRDQASAGQQQQSSQHELELRSRGTSLRTCRTASIYRSAHARRSANAQDRSTHEGPLGGNSAAKRVGLRPVHVAGPKAASDYLPARARDLRIESPFSSSLTLL